MTEDVKKWEKAAEDTEKLIPHMPEPDREHCKDVAANYRRNATHYKSTMTLEVGSHAVTALK
jgi:hypothetical protein